MRLGLQISSFDFPGGTQAIGPRLADVARAADDAGLASLWTMDHFFQIEYVGEVDEPMLEAYTTLGYLAAVTRRIRLGTLVTGVVYRYPGMLVKTATTLDVLSGGRAYLGLGAAWFEREALGLGMPFPPLRERFEQLEETLRIAHAMWAGDMTPIRGRHYRLEEPLSRPQPLSQPHPPILIGGGGETKTLRLVAQYADACNLFAYDGTKPILHKLDVLKRHCESVGRPYESIERTALGRLEDVTRRGGLQRAVEACRELAQAGIQHLIISLPDDRALASLEILGRDVIPEVSGF
jgi:F420-dependent oxidoreductase-like protein